jgi:hypothetical protein
MLLRADCDQEPENCVRICERSKAEGPCFALQEELLDCYQAAPPSDFVCTGQGFSTTARPQEYVCAPERDALIECAYPDVKACLDLCRVVEAAYIADAGPDAQNPEERTCPSQDIPCDSICWIAGRFYSLPVDGGVQGGSSADVSVSGSGLGPAEAEQLVACALGRANRCRNGEPEDGAPDGAVQDSTWATVLTDCADELGF